MWVHNIHVWVSEYERDLRDLVDFDPFPSALKQYDLGQNKVFKFVCSFVIWGNQSQLGQGNGNPLQYTCLKNPMDRRAW